MRYEYDFSVWIHYDSSSRLPISTQYESFYLPHPINNECNKWRKCTSPSKTFILQDKTWVRITQSHSQPVFKRIRKNSSQYPDLQWFVLKDGKKLINSIKESTKKGWKHLFSVSITLKILSLLLSFTETFSFR